jgi:hypothetical protein
VSAVAAAAAAPAVLLLLPPAGLCPEHMRADAVRLKGGGDQLWRFCQQVRPGRSLARHVRPGCSLARHVRAFPASKCVAAQRVWSWLSRNLLVPVGQHSMLSCKQAGS